MCGIAGFVGFFNSSDINDASDSLSRRGPDSSGYYSDDSQQLVLIHRRLSIVDLDHGAQPMRSYDSNLIVVFNGEIYNHRELRGELERIGCLFSSDHSDTEVLLWAYKIWGVSMLDHLDGMFAFCIYDKLNKCLFLARDRMGEKPLYYHCGNNRFSFASTILAIIVGSGIRPTSDTLSMAKYFGYGFIPSPHTQYKEVHKLPPGTYAFYDLEKYSLTVRRYYTYSIVPSEYQRDSLESYAEEMRALLQTSVRERLVSDRKVGVFLSGGLDSNALLSECARMPDLPVSAFTIGFNQRSYDESGLASASAKHFNIPHYLSRIDIADCMRIIDDLMINMDEPIADSSCIPTYILSQLASNHVAVALTGDGSDELFAGYSTFKALQLANAINKYLPNQAITAVKYLSSRIKPSDRYMSLGYKLQRFVNVLGNHSSTWNPTWLAPLELSEINLLLGTNYTAEEVYSEAISEWCANPKNSLTDNSILFFVKFYLPENILVKSDRMSMLFGLETRSPFLSNSIVDFSSRLPTRFKFSNGTTKIILRKAYHDVLPKWILEAPKRGFSLPISKWYRDGKLSPYNFGTVGDEAVSQRIYQKHIVGVADKKIYLYGQQALAASLKYEKY